jgi:sugar porter (SP) family MFS transporter
LDDSIGNGINTATAPVWQTETSPMKWRGKLVVLELMMTIFGFMVVNWVNYGLSFAGGALAWRLPLALQLVFILVLFLTTPWLPESPRWLLSHGYEKEALAILADLEKKSPDDPVVIAEHGEIIYSIEYERSNAVRWRDLLLGRANTGTKTIRRLLLGVATQAFQQFGGINILGYYLPTLLQQSVGMSETMARLIAAVSAVVYFIASGVAAPLVERFGRRQMMLSSTGIQFVCFFIITILLYYSQKPGYSGSQTTLASASVVFFFLYYVGFGLGMLGIPWLYPTEINSLPMRTKGAALATMTNWITNFAVVEVTPIGLQNLGWKFYIVWTVTNAVFLPAIYLFFPETGQSHPSPMLRILLMHVLLLADRTLEDVDAYYRENPSLIVIKDKDAVSRKRPLKYIEAAERDVLRAAGKGGSSTEVNADEKA